MSDAPRWMQVFIYKDRQFTYELTRRAKEAGYGALVLTVDPQLLGNRERDLRNGFTIPPRFGGGGRGDGPQDALAVGACGMNCKATLSQLCPKPVSRRTSKD